MADGNSLINFGDLSKPATVLIEKVSNAIGTIFEPYQIKRIALAEAEALKIKTLAHINVTELEQRALERFVKQETRKQQNIENITAGVISQLPPDANVEKLDEDWVAYFFSKCDTVSDKDMQSLWSRLLLGEAMVPTTYSRRTIDFVSSIDKDDAALFSTFCQFVWLIEEPTPIIYNRHSEIYAQQGISFAKLKHLDAIGLISFDHVNAYIKTDLNKHLPAIYFDKSETLEFPYNSGNVLTIGSVIFTKIGKELFPICGASPNQEFYKFVVQKWFSEGLLPSLPF
jgi:hypothetical protein